MNLYCESIFLFQSQTVEIQTIENQHGIVNMAKNSLSHRHFGCKELI